jgi:hypothetical protein
LAKRFQGVSLAGFPRFIGDRAQVDLRAMREKLDEVISPDAVSSIGRKGDPVGQNQNPGLGTRHAVEPIST